MYEEQFEEFVCGYWGLKGFLKLKMVLLTNLQSRAIIPFTEHTSAWPMFVLRRGKTRVLR